jgi:uncharacterized protein
VTEVSGETHEGAALVGGSARAAAIVLDEPLSLWGGVDADGRVVDRHHPQYGASVRRRVLVMPAGRGSSSSSTVLAEAIRRRVAPAGIVLRRVDPIIVLGALVGRELYGRAPPVVVLAAGDYEALRTGDLVEIACRGAVATVAVTRPEGGEPATCSRSRDARDARP